MRNQLLTTAFLVTLGYSQSGCVLDSTGYANATVGTGGSTSSASSSGGVGGSTSSSNSGGSGGMGGETTSTANSGGSGSTSTTTTTTTSSSSTGDGGSGGGNPVVPTCSGGDAGTVTNITASGAIETALLVHYQDGMETFSVQSPTVLNATSKVMPAQLVLVGKEGAQFDLKAGASAIAKSYYEVNLATLPQAECSGANLKSQNCLEQVAQSFRCQFPPYLENSSCPPPVTFTALGSTNNFTNSNPGYQMLLVHLSCL